MPRTSALIHEIPTPNLHARSVMHHIIRRWAVVLLILCLLAMEAMATEPISRENASDLVQIAVLDDPSRAVYSVAWSPDGTRLASGSDDGKLLLIDTAAWEVVREITTGYGAVWSVAWSPDGSRLATGSRDGYVRLWDAQTGEKIVEFPGSPVFSVAWSPQGNLLAIGHSTGTVRIVDPSSGEELASWRGHIEGGHSTEVVALAWSPDGQTLASGGIDYAVRLWDREGNPLTVFRADTAMRNDINGLAWSPDGRKLAAAGQAASIREWDVAAGEEVAIYRIVGGTWARGVAYSPSGDILATTGSDRALTLWDVSEGTQIARLLGHEAPIWSVAWSPDGTMLATGSGFYQSASGDTSIRVWAIP